MKGRHTPKALIDFLGVSDHPEPAEILSEATEGNAALRAFEDLFPLLTGDGLADYLRNLAAEVTTLYAERDDAIRRLRLIGDVLDSEPDGPS